MYDDATRARVLELAALGLSNSTIAGRTGISRSTVRAWRSLPSSRLVGRERCDACGHAPHRFSRLPDEYVYVLGMYLGDGLITEHRRHVQRLRIYLDAQYPDIVRETAAAVGRLVPERAVHVQQYARGARLSIVSAYSRQWGCLLPQHGPGPKHTRRIALASWQEALIRRRPQLFLRGLVHSDGCRSLNTVSVGTRRYAYWRYTFTNASADIRQLFSDTCDLLEIPWRRMNHRTISIARRSGVARMDVFVGAKS